MPPALSVIMNEVKNRSRPTPHTRTARDPAYESPEFSLSASR
jgi:hypothetical protein